MALKRRNRIEASFSMASMTDVIFLLLIFLWYVDICFPECYKSESAAEQTAGCCETVGSRYHDASLNYYVSVGKAKAVKVAYEELPSYLVEARNQDPEMYFALYADESVPYREIMKVLNVANDNQLRMVLATQPVKE